MPIYGRRHEPGQLQFITTSTYRRSKLFEADCFRWAFVHVLRQIRQETAFLLMGWVLMPWSSFRFYDLNLSFLAMDRQI
jgi:hypothetical protein